MHFLHGSLINRHYFFLAGGVCTSQIKRRQKKKKLKTAPHVVSISTQSLSVVPMNFCMRSIWINRAAPKYFRVGKRNWAAFPWFFFFLPCLCTLSQQQIEIYGCIYGWWEDWPHLALVMEESFDHIHFLSGPLYSYSKAVCVCVCGCKRSVCVCMWDESFVLVLCFAALYSTQRLLGEHSRQ